MAPVPPRTWGHGVPGELQVLPGPAHSYRLSAAPVRRLDDGPAGRPGESAPPRTSHSFARALPSGQPIAIYTLPPGASVLQVSHANTTKRGLYV
jgi:hypothetical protein